MKHHLADALYHALWAERAQGATKAALIRLGADDAALNDAIAGLEHLYDCQKSIKAAMALKGSISQYNQQLRENKR